MTNLLTIRNLAVNFNGLPAVDRISLVTSMNGSRSRSANWPNAA